MKLLHHGVVLGAVAVSLLTFRSGALPGLCGTTEASGAMRMEGVPRYESVVLTDDKEKETPKLRFGPDTPKIFALGKLADVASGTTVKAVWIAEETQVTPPDYKIDQTEMKAGGLMNRTTFSLSRPNAGWPAGKYRVELYLAGRLVKTLRFVVTGP